MHKSLKALFAEHANPKHCNKAHVMATSKPSLKIASDNQRQVAEYRAILLDAETSEDLPDALRGKLRLMQNTLAALDRCNAACIAAERERLDAVVQLDRVFADAKTDLETWEARSLELP